MPRRVLFVGGDLNARARISAAAAAGGATWATSSSAAILDRLSRDPFDLLILDLDGEGKEVLPFLGEAEKRGIKPSDVIGYYSHVDVEGAEKARAAGVTPIRRGRFWRDLAGFFGPVDG